MAGAKKLRAQGVLKKTDLVVVVATAHALKFSSPAIAFHKSGRAGANPPRAVPADLDAVAAALGLRG
jgi:threonine synthase